MEDSSLECVASPAGQSSSRSKLDTLSKEDLIKFAKKQMAAMQMIKSKCAGLEKEVEELKHPPSGSSDSSVIQELSERMEAVLLEKAESQQSLSLLRRQHEELQKQAQETRRSESTAADTFEQTVSPIKDQEDLGDRAERFMKQYRAVKERTAGSLQDLQEKLQSVFQQRDRLFEQIRNADETSDPAEEAERLEMSFEDLRNTNEEILVSLQHKETLVLELKEMLKSMASESKLNQRRNLSEEKHMKTLEEDASALQARQQECQDTIRLLQSQITSLSEERDALRRDVERLLTHAQAERAVLRQRLEEAGEERAAQIHELLREKDLLKASLEDELLDTEELQKDLRDMQAMNVKLRAENHSLLSQVADLSRSLERLLGCSKDDEY